MDETISANDADRNFSELLHSVREGHRYLVTAQGAPVARIIPAEDRSPDRTDAKRRLMARLKSQPLQILDQRWNRDELYES